MAVGYAGLGKLFVLVSSLVNVVALVYPPRGTRSMPASGWATVYGRVSPRRVAADAVHAHAELASLAMACRDTADRLRGVAMLRGRLGFSRRLDQPREVVGLAGVVSAVSAPLSATVGVPALWLAGEVPPSEDEATRCTWWLAAGGRACHARVWRASCWPPAR